MEFTLEKTKQPLKILHIGNIANNAGTLAMYQNIMGHNSNVISRGNQNTSKYNLYPEFVRVIESENNIKPFLIRAIIASRKADVIHVHIGDLIVRYLRKIFPNKPIILQYRGTDIRRKWNDKDNKWMLADRVFVSTHDLLEGAPKTVEYIPNCPDINHFDENDILPKSNLGLYLHANIGEAEVIATNWAIDMAKKYNIDLYSFERNFPHSIFPKFLRMFEYYFDRKITFDAPYNLIDALSTNAIQFLALGGERKVIFKDKIIDHLPDEFHPNSVMQKWENIYQELVK